MSSPLNIADRLRQSARAWPWQRAVVCPVGRDRQGRTTYSQLTFHQLDQESDQLAWGLQRIGVQPGQRIVLMVRPSIPFMALTFALFKAGAVIVLIDPGMGRSNISKCLEEVDPEGFVAIPTVHWIRTLSRRFPRARLNVRVGGPWAPGCIATYTSLRSGTGADEYEFPIHRTQPTSPAAVIFTSGSTGPPKGVLYEHGMFNAQVELLQQFYGIHPGEVDLPGFPLFGLFNAAMGVTTVVPDMDPTKPAQVNPLRIIEAIRDNGVTQAFGSPALWSRVGSYCIQHSIELPSLRRALSAGGPVPIRVLETMTKVLTGNAAGGVILTENSPRKPGDLEEPADLHTPYGATESLPVASIGAREVLTRTAEKTRQGAGTCVGRAFPGVNIRIIPVTDGPITSFNDTRSLPPGEIGEIIVRSPSVTREYFCRPESTVAAKIPDGDSFWHRIGDVGYLDEEGLLWFCGRKAHIVYPVSDPMYSVCCEAIFEAAPWVYRAALVGVGSRGSQTPVMIIEPERPDSGHRLQVVGSVPQRITHHPRAGELLEFATTSPLTKCITRFLLIDSMPVDTRHNVKIHRESLAVWAEKQLNSESQERQG